MLIRALDLLIALGGLVLLLPLFAVIALIIRIGSPGPVFYIHERIGLNGKPFRMFKFRTMVVGAARAGPYYTEEGDPRITGVGAWLRRYSLDELPELLNVLRGEMSLVGPRPDVAEQLSLYTPEQRRLRHSVRPGLTGLAQITSRHQGPLQRRLESDLRWVREIGLRMYLAILFKTVWVLIRQRSF